MYVHRLPLLTHSCSQYTFTPPGVRICHTDVPVLTIVNSSVISVQWNRSSSFRPNVSISYLLVVRNESDQFDLHEESFNTTAEFTSYPLSYQFFNPGVDNLGCHNISFVILARSSDGENERPGRAVSGFPVGKLPLAPVIMTYNYALTTVLSQFSSAVSLTVTFTGDLEPILDIAFDVSL